MPAPLLAAAAPIATRLAGSFAMRMGGAAAAKAAMRATPGLINFALGPGSKALGTAGSALGPLGKAAAAGIAINAATSAAGFIGSTLSTAVPAYMAINAFTGKGGENGISFGKVLGATMLFKAAPDVGKAVMIAAGIGLAFNYLNQNNNAAQLANNRQMVLDSANDVYSAHLSGVAQRLNSTSPSPSPSLGNIFNAPILAAPKR